MKTDHYTPLPSWEITLDELLALLNRGPCTLELIAQEAPWFDPRMHRLDTPAHPIFRREAVPHE